MMRYLAARNILLWKDDPLRHRHNFEIFCLVLLCAFVPFTEAKQTTGDFDPKTLAESLRNTKAIGFFTKLQLKSEIDGLLDDLKELNQGKKPPTLAQLHERFQLLFHKIVTLVQDKDPKLAKSITDARQSLWQWLSDPNTSVKL